MHPAHEWDRSASRRPVGQWRQLAITAVALLLLAFVVETGRHSVHHLDEDRAAPECWVAAVATHTPATGVQAVVVAPAAPGVVQVVVDFPPAGPTSRSVGTQHERAPPVAPSA